MQERYGIKFTFLILKIKIINKIDICILIRLNIALIALISITKDYYYYYYYLNKLLGQLVVFASSAPQLVYHSLYHYT